MTLRKEDKVDHLKKLIYEDNKYCEISTLLLNSIYTSTVVEKNKLFANFYDLVAQKFENDESKIYLYLKNHFDSELIQNVIDGKFPGCMDGCKKRLESLAGKKFIEHGSEEVVLENV